MAELNADRTEVRARLLYWGAAGAGKTANLMHVHRKLRADHRGEMRHIPTPIDPTVTFEQLPIDLGELAGMQVRLQVSTAPGGPEHGPTRKQLLDQVDGVVLVIDSSPDRLEANLAAFDELRSSLTAYGRSLDDLALVVQYNKRDLADDFTLEELHRKLDLRGAAVFEAVATEGKGVLQALTTISKQVVRRLRGDLVDTAEPTPPAAEPASPVRAPEPATPISVPPLTDPNLGAPEPIVDPHPTPPPQSIGALPPDQDSVLSGLEAEYASPETAALAAEAVGEAEALFDAPLVPEPHTDVSDLAIDTIGSAAQTGPRAFAVPMTLRDAAGRTYTMTVRVILDPGEASGD